MFSLLKGWDGSLSSQTKRCTARRKIPEIVPVTRPPQPLWHSGHRGGIPHTPGPLLCRSRCRQQSGLPCSQLNPEGYLVLTWDFCRDRRTQFDWSSGAWTPRQGCGSLHMTCLPQLCKLAWEANELPAEEQGLRAIRRRLHGLPRLHVKSLTLQKRKKAQK